MPFPCRDRRRRRSLPVFTARPFASLWIGADRARPLQCLGRRRPEPLSVVRSNEPLRFARACYHLGNRHVSLQILPGELRYLSDHVLDHMIEGLGLTVTRAELPFEPEAGAYRTHDH